MPTKTYKSDDFTVSVPVDGLPDVAKYIFEHAPDGIRNAATVAQGIARANAPRKSGALIEGIVVNPYFERNSTPGKLVADVWMDPKKNDVFVKYSDVGAKKPKRYYYPASQNYGFNVGNGHVAGKYFMQTAGVQVGPVVTKEVAAILDDMIEELTG